MLPTKLPIQRTVVSLVIVLGSFVLVATMLKGKGGGPAEVPEEICVSLGSVRLTPKQRLHLMRLGPRILLLSMAGESVHCVAEVSDPKTVEEMVQACRGGTTRLTRTMRDALTQIEAVGPPADERATLFTRPPSLES